MGVLGVCWVCMMPWVWKHDNSPYIAYMSFKQFWLLIVGGGQRSVKGTSGQDMKTLLTYRKSVTWMNRIIRW